MLIIFNTSRFTMLESWSTLWWHFLCRFWLSSILYADPSYVYGGRLTHEAIQTSRTQIYRLSASHRFPERHIPVVTYQSLRKSSRREKGSRASWNVGWKGESCSLAGVQSRKGEYTVACYTLQKQQVNIPSYTPIQIHLTCCLPFQFCIISLHFH